MWHNKKKMIKHERKKKYIREEIHRQMTKAVDITGTPWPDDASIIAFSFYPIEKWHKSIGCVPVIRRNLPALM